MQGRSKTINIRLNSVRRRIGEYPGLQRNLFIYVMTMLAANMFLIVYVVVSIVARMTLNGVPFIDSAPLSLYILPLIVILVLIFNGYRKTRVGLPCVIVFLLAGLVFGLVSGLVHGFIILAILNILAVITIPLIGPLRSGNSIRESGKKGIALFIVLNILGALFPIAVVTMGNTPITHVTARLPSQINVDVPLTTDNMPSNDTLQLLEDNQVGVNLRLFEYSETSWNLLRNWVSNLMGRGIDVTITLTTDRESLASKESLGSNELFATMYSHMSGDVSRIGDIIETYGPISGVDVLLDLRLSDTEWESLMASARNVNLIGFSSLIRRTIDHLNITLLEHSINHIISIAQNESLGLGVLVDSLVLDDYLDGDGVIMSVGGVTPTILDRMDLIEVDISRTKFSDSMNGDVGEYLAFTYGSTVARLSDQQWSIRLGAAGNTAEGVTYSTVTRLASDVALVGGCGVKQVTIESLDGIQSLGPSGLGDLVTLTDVPSSIPVTYTFRIYAFRAVIIAIDSFDPIIF